MISQVWGGMVFCMHATLSLAVNNPRNQELPGESHEKGFAKDADVKASEGILSFGGFLIFLQHR